MKVGQVHKSLGLTVFNCASPDREVKGGYSGDLLSWVMGRAAPGDAWITIMSNRNIIAVATMADTAMIILSEGVAPDTGVDKMASEHGINLFGSSLSSFELCARLHELI